MSCFKSEPKLSRRVLGHILDGKRICPPLTFQLLSLRNVSDKDVNGNITTRKYFLELSDGQSSYGKCLIDGDLCGLVDEQKLACCSILKIKDYRVREINEERILHLDSIERLVDGNSFLKVIGDPKEIVNR